MVRLTIASIAIASIAIASIAIASIAIASIAHRHEAQWGRSALYGAARALRAEVPPRVSAGKNLR